MSSFLIKEAKCACKDKLVFECYIVVVHLSRGNKNDVLTNVKIDIARKQIKFVQQSNNEIKRNL